MKMFQRGTLGPKEVPMLGGGPERCPCESVPFLFCWPTLLHNRSGIPEYLHYLQVEECIFPFHVYVNGL